MITCGMMFPERRPLHTDNALNLRVVRVRVEMNVHVLVLQGELYEAGYELADVLHRTRFDNLLATCATSHDVRLYTAIGMRIAAAGLYPSTEKSSN